MCPRQFFLTYRDQLLFFCWVLVQTVDNDLLAAYSLRIKRTKDYSPSPYKRERFWEYNILNSSSQRRWSYRTSTANTVFNLPLPVWRGRGNLRRSAHDQRSQSSPQLWTGRSTTAHIVFDLRSLIWGLDESCTIFMASFHSKPMPCQFRRLPLLQCNLTSGTSGGEREEFFERLVCGVRGREVSGINPFSSPHMGVPVDTI